MRISEAIVAAAPTHTEHVIESEKAADSASKAGRAMFNPATPESLKVLARQLPEAAFRPFDARYRSEPRGSYFGDDGFVIAPSSAAEVSKVVKFCGTRRIPLVPFGGGTGLVGGQIGVGLPTPIVLSMERMDKIRRLDPVDNVVVAEAGCTLQAVQEAALEAGRQFPLSIASQGSSQIGGNLATNAGGVRVLRYGNMRDLCLGVEAVLPDGSIWNGLSALRKDNLGYDLKHLLIGSEGTLGLITAASLTMRHSLADTAAAVFAVKDPRGAVELLDFFRVRFGGEVSAFELIAGTGLDFLAEALPDIRLPFSERHEWLVLAEIGAESERGMHERMEDASVAALDEGLVRDGAMARSVAQASEFWRMRESIPAANKRIGAVSSHDISVPVSKIPDFIERAGSTIQEIGDFRINCFGHLGDGNLHYNVFPPVGGGSVPASREKVRQAVFGLVREYGGSISAEHGVGRANASELAKHGDPAFVAAMRRIKFALDPEGIMNPGAVIDS